MSSTEFGARCEETPITPRPSWLTSRQIRRTSSSGSSKARVKTNPQRHVFGQGDAVVGQAERDPNRIARRQDSAGHDGRNFPQAVAEAELGPAIVDAKMLVEQLELGHLHRHDQGDRVAIRVDRSFDIAQHAGDQIDRPAQNVRRGLRQLPQVPLDRRAVGRVHEQLPAAAQVDVVVAAKGQHRVGKCLGQLTWGHTEMYVAAGRLSLVMSVTGKHPTTNDQGLMTNDK